MTFRLMKFGIRLIKNAHIMTKNKLGRLLRIRSSITSQRVVPYG